MDSSASNSGEFRSASEPMALVAFAPNALAVPDATTVEAFGALTVSGPPSQQQAVAGGGPLAAITQTSIEVTQAVGLALSCLAPVPAVLFRRLQQDTARLHNDTQSRAREVTRQVWAALSGGSEAPAFLQDVPLPRDAQPGQPLDRRCLISELLVAQLRTVLAQDIDKVRSTLRWGVGVADSTTKLALLSRPQHVWHRVSEVDGGPQTTFEGYWLPRPRQRLRGIALGGSGGRGGRKQVGGSAGRDGAGGGGGSAASLPSSASGSSSASWLSGVTADCVAAAATSPAPAPARDGNGAAAAAAAAAAVGSPSSAPGIEACSRGTSSPSAGGSAELPMGNGGGGTYSSEAEACTGGGGNCSGEARQRGQQQQQQWRAEEEDCNLTILYIHGGAFAVGSALSYRPFFESLQRAVSEACPGMQVRLFSLEYTLAPDAVFPTQLHECVAAYRWLAGHLGHTRIVLAGDSAGGNLALATASSLRDAYPALPRPLGCILISPWADLSREYESPITSDLDYLTLAGPSVDRVTINYLGEAAWCRQALKHPLVSPALGDLRGLPPMHVNAGSGEVLLELIQELVVSLEAAGVTVDKHVGQAMFHVYPCLATGYRHPEALLAVRRMARFVADISGYRGGGEGGGGDGDGASGLGRGGDEDEACEIEMVPMAATAAGECGSDMPGVGIGDGDDQTAAGRAADAPPAPRRMARD